ncbi:acyl-CoA dehydrogenase family protein [Pseudomonas sp. R26(2017)]|uniref:acyl-CoA dehydrogenase family protein n=1 Tax=unclassified Pseudomonas TaxID=196821 RepID=UPI000A1FCCD3
MFPPQKSIYRTLRSDVILFSKMFLCVSDFKKNHTKQSHKVVIEKWNRLCKFGFTRLILPVEYGGLGVSFKEYIVVMEGLGFGCKSLMLPYSLSSHLWSMCMPILNIWHQ